MSKLPHTDPDYKDEFSTVSRNELLAFLEWLRNRKKPIIVHTIYTAGFFNRFRVDAGVHREWLLKKIKEANTLESAYVAAAQEEHFEVVCRRDVKDALGVRFYYAEDFYEYLLKYYTKERARQITRIVCAGEYKHHVCNAKKNATLYAVSEALFEYAKGIRSLPSRRAVITDFEYEYELYTASLDI